MNDAYYTIEELIAWIDSYVQKNREALSDNDIECLDQIRDRLKDFIKALEGGGSPPTTSELAAIAGWIIRLTVAAYSGA